MNDKFNQLEALLGTSVEREDLNAPFQCMDFAFAWCDILGIDRATIRRQFAYQVWTQPNDIELAYFIFIPNTPNGIPQKGDVPIFLPNIPNVTSDAGHICVATGEGDENAFTSLDENWNGVSHVTKEQHRYTGVAGWLRPRLGGSFVDAETYGRLIAESAKFEDIVKIGYNSADDITTRTDSLQSQISALETQNEELIKEVKDAKDAIKTQTENDSPSLEAGLDAIHKNKELTSDLLVVALQLGVQYPNVKNLTDAIAEMERQVKLYRISQNQQSQNIQSFWQFFIKKFFGKGG